MKPSVYRERDYAFGQRMLTLRSAMGLTQAELAQALGVSRRSVLDWESGAKYPKAVHLKQFVALAVTHQAFLAGEEVDQIQALWKAAHQKELLNEVWLSDMLSAAEHTARVAASEAPANDHQIAASASVERKLTGNLPFQPTTFVGRSAELVAIARLLANPACRLLTLHGPGGIGKTRLALAVAASEAAAFADGVVFVALAAISMPGQIVSTIGEALGMSFDGQSAPISQLFDELRGRRILLLLDNFEHLLEGADLISAVLAHTSQVKILVTSRERLNLQAEWLFNVDGLGFPHQHLDALILAQSFAVLKEFSAVELFIQRTRQVQPALVLDDAALTSIAQICQHVAGMPLAIELAAASVRVLSVGEIERQIRANLDVLTTSLRDVPARHRSMRAVFDHSWKLLSEEQRTLFSRLAVFRSGWTAEAAATVTGASHDLFTALVDKSLVRSQSATTAGLGTDVPTNTPEPRFTMLESIRGYALEQLAARGEEATVRQAHAIYYTALAEAAAARWSTPMKEQALAQLGREHNNMRAALQWAIETGNSMIGLQLALVLWDFWRNYGYNSEGRSWFGQLLDLDQHPTELSGVSMRERALHAAAWLASDQHDFANAEHLFEQSMELRRRLGAASGETKRADLLRNAARQARAEGNYQQATALLEDILAQYGAAGVSPTTVESIGLELSLNEFGEVLRELGSVLREQGEFGRATALLEQALAIHRGIGNQISEAFTLIGLADVARDQGDSMGVREHCEPSLAILRAVGMQWAVGFALNNLALAAYYEHDLKGAAIMSQESVALFRSISADTCLSEVLITQGTILWAQGNAVEAYDAFAEALRFALAVGPRLFVALASEGLARVVVAQGDAELATRLLVGASALRYQMSTPVRLVDQADVAQVVANARSAVGEDAFATVWATVETRPLDQILSPILSIATFKEAGKR